MTYTKEFYVRSLALLSLNIIAINSNTIAQNAPVIKEAEAAALGSDFSMLTSGGITYITPQTDFASTSSPGNDTKVTTFSVQFNETGTYDLYLKVRVGAGNFGDDSFYIGRGFGSMSSTTTADWHTINGIVNIGHSVSGEVVTGAGTAGGLTWKWINISEYLGATPSTFTVDQTATPYIFQYGSRENGFDLDKIAFGKADLPYTVANLENGESGGSGPPGEAGYPESAYRLVKTYSNPVLPGDHPDLTLLKVGNDFYSCGSSFHFTPYLPILRSTDLVHWQEVSRVVPVDWSALLNDAPKYGIWQGAITRFYNSYWIYFSNTAGGGQYFSKASTPSGPWSTPVKVNTTPDTGASGYDNSVFVDDDGTPYMLIKPGRNTNRIQRIGTDGHLTGSVINMDWVNAINQYSWAEGPVMCKRNGWYYYFIAGNIGGGQYVLRSQTLSANEGDWEALGNFFADITDASAPFKGPNHMSQPFQLEDGTWWTISHSYEANDWGGQGRQGLLHQVIWDSNGKPKGVAPTSAPLVKPNLPKSATPWKLPRSDYFDNDKIDLAWHFLNKAAVTKHSLTSRSGWVTIDPGTVRSHILQKSGGHFYTLVTRVNIDAKAAGEQAGIYIANGNESVNARLYSGYASGKKIIFTFNTTSYEVPNTLGNTLWLKVDRREHELSGYYSADGVSWTQIGSKINVVDLDKSQPENNWWVGNSIGLYAEKKKADFDLFLYKDGFSELPAAGWNNSFGVEAVSKSIGTVMTNSTSKAGWLMLGGVDLGKDQKVPYQVTVSAASSAGGSLEIWLDDIENEGKLIATVPISNTGGTDTWRTFSAGISNVSGQHDVYIRFSSSEKTLLVNTISFVPVFPVTGVQEMANGEWLQVYPNPFTDSLSVVVKNGKANYVIRDLSGRKVESGQVNKSANGVGSSLSPALYLLTVETPQRSVTVKVTKTSK